MLTSALTAPVTYPDIESDPPGGRDVVELVLEPWLLEVVVDVRAF